MDESTNYNVIDEYKGKTVEEIKTDIAAKHANFSVLVENLKGGLNTGIILRNANAFGAQKVYYYGEKHWDRRSAVGVHNYTDLIRIKTLEELIELIKNEGYTVIGIDNIESAGELRDFISDQRELLDVRCHHDHKGYGPFYMDNYLLIFGEEGEGISEELLYLCDNIVYIEQYGSVRSLNVSSAAAIVLYEFRRMYNYYT